MSFDMYSNINLNSTTTFTGVVPLGPAPIERYAQAQSRPFWAGLAELSVSSGVEERPLLTVEEFPPFQGGVLQTQLTEEKKTTKKLSECIWVKVEKKQREEVMKLPNEVRMMNCFTQKRFKDCFKYKSTLLKNAFFADKFSEKKIFNLNIKSIVKISVFREQREKIKLLLAGPNGEKIKLLLAGPNGTTTGWRMLETLRNLTGEEGVQQDWITVDTARKINTCFGIAVFDLVSLWAEAIQEAEKEAELLPALGSKKRSLSDTGATAEADFEPASKKQRTDGSNIGTDSDHTLTADDYLAAMILVGLRQSAFSLAAPLSSGQTTVTSSSLLSPPLSMNKQF